MKHLVVLGLFLSLPAFAAEPNNKLHESKLLAAEKWDDVSENLKAWLPGSVVKEFKTSVEGKPYPSVRKLKYGIQVTQNNGMRVTIQFKSNGRISFNGKDWRFKPLESIDNQVEQLALFLSGDQKRAGFEMIPSAYSAGNSGADKGAFGLAALAFASANAWKADACDEAGLTDELVEDCTLMAVAMRWDIEGWKKQARGYGLYGEIRRATVETGKDNGGFYPVGLKCPTSKDGRLESISKDENGNAMKYFLELKAGKPNYVGYQISQNGANFKPYKGLRISDLKNSEEKELFEYWTKKGRVLISEVCNGSKSEREKYFVAIRSNADKLNKASFSNFEEDGKPSIESF